MKRRIGLWAVALLAGLTLVPSCNKSDSAEPIDPLSTPLESYRNINRHNVAAMDPFFVAHRLDLYLNNGATGALLTELFHQATVTTEDNRTYIVDYKPTAAPVDDYLRSGKLIVDTGGASLSSPGAIWQVYTEQDSLDYVMAPDEVEAIDVRIARGDYTIEALAADRWRVVADELFLARVYSGGAALWSLDTEIARVRGGEGGHPAELRFTIKAADTPANGGLAFGMTNRYRWQTPEPVLYMPSCGPGSTRSGGMERVIRMDSYGYAAVDTVEVDFGREFVCNPSFSLSARVDSVWTTVHY